MIMAEGERYKSQVSTVSVDAETWSYEGNQSDQRSMQGDPQGAIPRTSGRQIAQPSSLVPITEQLYTGRGRESQKQSDNSSPTNLSRDEFIDHHFEKLSKELKVAFYDVMVLYNSEDYVDAEKFREHLETDIFPEEPKKIKAVLYDGPELEGLSASKLQHLDGGFQRCTFTFVYLTKQFVECDWCNLSSETCLMEAIYNPQKKWCVVPVYTVQRNKADFRIPMGLNSLKGINYYNADDFYRKGVRRLIGDKINQRKENEKGLHQRRYNYLVKKVKEEKEWEARLQYEHERAQRELQNPPQQVGGSYRQDRSQSMMERERNILYTSGDRLPKTAGYLPEPPSFPPDYVKHQSDPSMSKHTTNTYIPKNASEGDDLSSMSSQLQKQSLGGEDREPYSNEPEHTPSSLPVETSQQSMECDDLSRDYHSQSLPHDHRAPQKPHDHQTLLGHYPVQYAPQNVHYHYYYKHERREPPQAKTFNINADNVIIGENGQIIADGKKMDLEREEYDDDSHQSTVSDKRRESEHGTSYTVDGYPTRQSTETVKSDATGNSQAVEHDDEEIACIAEVNPTVHKETLTKLKSVDVQETDLKNPANKGDNLHNISSDIAAPTQGHCDKPNDKGKLTKDQSSSAIVTHGSPLNSSSRPVKLPTKQPSPLVAKVQPITNRSSPKISPEMFNAGGSPVTEDTCLKRAVTPHQTDRKVVSEDDETSLKCVPQSSPVDPDITEVLKPYGTKKSPRLEKGSQSSLETDGCCSLNTGETILTKDDLDIKAVRQCLDMGFSEEQIRDALTLLRQHRPGHHHFSHNDLLDALLGKTSHDVKGEEDNWVTLDKDDMSDDSQERKSSLLTEKVSLPVPIQKSSTEPDMSNSPKSKSQSKGSCKMQ